MASGLSPSQENPTETQCSQDLPSVHRHHTSQPQMPQINIYTLQLMLSQREGALENMDMERELTTTSL